MRQMGGLVIDRLDWLKHIFISEYVVMKKCSTLNDKGRLIINANMQWALGVESFS